MGKTFNKEMIYPPFATMESTHIIHVTTDQNIDFVETVLAT